MRPTTHDTTRPAAMAGLALALVATLIGASACGDSPAARQKAAQANADKYFELLMVGDYEGAYRNTFSAQYRSSLPLETFVKFRQAMMNQTGPIQSYAVTESKPLPNGTGLKLTYSLQTANAQAPVYEIIRIVPEGSEWRIQSVEPKIERPTPQGPADGSAPMPRGK